MRLYMGVELVDKVLQKHHEAVQKENEREQES